MCLRGLRSRPARGNRLRSAGGHGVCRRTSRQASGGEGVPEGDRNLQPLVVAGDLGPGRGDAARRQNRRRRGSIASTILPEAEIAGPRSNWARPGLLGPRESTGIQERVAPGRPTRAPHHSRIAPATSSEEPVQADVRPTAEPRTAWNAGKARAAEPPSEARHAWRPAFRPGRDGRSPFARRGKQER